MTHICVSKLSIIGSDNGLSPGRRQSIIRTNAGILLIGTLGTNFSEILSEIHTFKFTKMHWKMSSGRWRPFCLGLNVLKSVSYIRVISTHSGLVISYGIRVLSNHCFRQWLVAWWQQAITWNNGDLSLVSPLVNPSNEIPDNKVHGANMGPIWDRQDPGGPHVGPMNLAIWDAIEHLKDLKIIFSKWLFF